MERHPERNDKLSRRISLLRFAGVLCFGTIGLISTHLAQEDLRTLVHTEPDITSPVEHVADILDPTIEILLAAVALYASTKLASDTLH